MQRNLVTVNITVVDVIWTSDQKKMVANVVSLFCHICVVSHYPDRRHYILRGNQQLKAFAYYAAFSIIVNFI